MGRVLLAIALRLVDGLRALQRAFLGRLGFVRTWVVTPHGRVHALVRRGGGSGPTWVFVHGLSSQAGDWALMLLPLRKRCARIIVLDLPGHGASDQPAVGHYHESLAGAVEQALLALLPNDEPCVVVGNSLGGLAALDFTRRHPERVRGLVLISPAGAPMTRAELDATLGHFEVSTFRRALAFVDRIFVRRTPARPVIAMTLWAHLNRPYFRDLVASLRERGVPEPQAIAALPPTLLMWGDRDDLLPVSSRDWYLRALPASTTQVSQPAGFSHTPFAERAPEVAQLVVAWAEAQGGLLVGGA